MCLGCLVATFFSLSRSSLHTDSSGSATCVDNRSGLYHHFCTHTHRHNGMEMRFENIHTDRLLNVQLCFDSNRHGKNYERASGRGRERQINKNRSNNCENNKEWDMEHMNAVLVQQTECTYFVKPIFDRCRCRCLCCLIQFGFLYRPLLIIVITIIFLGDSSQHE